MARQKTTPIEKPGYTLIILTVARHTGWDTDMPKIGAQYRERSGIRTAEVQKFIERLEDIFHDPLPTSDRTTTSFSHRIRYLRQEGIIRPHKRREVVHKKIYYVMDKVYLVNKVLEMVSFPVRYDEDKDRSAGTRSGSFKEFQNQLWKNLHTHLDATFEEVLKVERIHKGLRRDKKPIPHDMTREWYESIKSLSIFEFLEHYIYASAFERLDERYKISDNEHMALFSSHCLHYLVKKLHVNPVVYQYNNVLNDIIRSMRNNMVLNSGALYKTLVDLEEDD